jgi:hypothetical protein
MNQRETGGYESYCAWSKTSRALLPKTDLIAFFDPTKQDSPRTLGLAKWDDVMGISGHLFLDTQMFPARLTLRNFQVMNSERCVRHTTYRQGFLGSLLSKARKQVVEAIR